MSVDSGAVTNYEFSDGCVMSDVWINIHAVAKRMEENFFFLF
jgi:hypothetical protein